MDISEKDMPALPVWHLFPVYLGRQLQCSPDSRSMHVPPLRQYEGVHLFRITEKVTGCW